MGERAQVAENVFNLIQKYDFVDVSLLYLFA
jgi:hypothetical protein